MGTAFKFAVFFSVFYDIFSGGCIDTRNVGKKSVGRGVDVNANAVNAVLNYSAERLGKARLLHIVLILTDTDCLGLNFNKLGKWVLYSSCNRDSAALHFVKLGKLLRCKL